MHKRIRLFIFVLFVLSCPFSARAAGPAPLYELYMELGKKALDYKDYQNAIMYFQNAGETNPDAAEPLAYINLIKRLYEYRLHIISPEDAQTIMQAADKDDLLEVARKRIEQEKILSAQAERMAVIDSALDAFDQTSYSAPVESIPALYPDVPAQEEAVSKAGFSPPARSFIGREIESEKETSFVRQEKIYLDDGLWATQPGTLIQLELRNTLILEGSNIERHLIISPGFMEIERIDRDRVIIKALKRGQTFLHAWDDRGRWTFNVEIILPVRRDRLHVKEQQLQEGNDPFKLSYSSDWGGFYRGPRFDKVTRDSVHFDQRLELFGETPYGDVGGGAVFSKLNRDVEVIQATSYLLDGHIGPFDDFNIRGYDFKEGLSSLTFPGQFVRGIYFDSTAFNKQLKYVYLRGRERDSFGLLSPGIIADDQAFIEGGKVILFPEEDTQFAFNYARGFGKDRDDFLKDQVFSVETEHRWHNLLFSGESAYDEENIASHLGAELDHSRYTFNVNVRDYDKDFVTISSFPGNRGELGSIMNFGITDDHYTFHTFVDLYRERFLPSTTDPNTLNVDFNTSLEIPLSERDRLRNSLYYLDTSGELSPRRNLRANTTYTKQIALGNNAYMSAFIGGTFQKSRFSQSPSSEFDRYAVNTGISLPLSKYLNYFVNYEFSWVDEKFSGEEFKPNVLYTGLNYDRPLAEHWRGNLSFSYRNEENTDGTNSFLAGEDSIVGTAGASFRPTPDFEWFINGRARNVWKEGPGSTAFNELDVRTGVRTTWELPFAWDAPGIVRGVVYKDLNGNQRRDQNEPGIGDVTVHAGNTQVVTNKAGEYYVKIRAKKAYVSVDIETVPSGHVFTTPVSRRIDILAHRTQHVDFGTSSEAGIYGSVYYDKNQNGRPDPDDEFVQRAVIILDHKDIVYSDFEGTYHFRSVPPGTHNLKIDINALPIEYLPAIKVENEIEVFEGTSYVFHIPLNKKK